MDSTPQTRRQGCCGGVNSRVSPLGAIMRLDSTVHPRSARALGRIRRRIPTDELCRTAWPRLQITRCGAGRLCFSPQLPREHRSHNRRLRVEFIRGLARLITRRLASWVLVAAACRLDRVRGISCGYRAWWFFPPVQPHPICRVRVLGFWRRVRSRAVQDRIRRRTLCFGVGPRLCWYRGIFREKGPGGLSRFHPESCTMAGPDRASLK